MAFVKHPDARPVRRPRDGRRLDRPGAHLEMVAMATLLVGLGLVLRRRTR